MSPGKEAFRDSRSFGSLGQFRVGGILGAILAPQRQILGVDESSFEGSLRFCFPGVFKP